MTREEIMEELKMEVMEFNHQYGKRATKSESEVVLLIEQHKDNVRRLQKKLENNND